MLGVVLLHACGPAMRLPVPGLVWPVFQPAHTSVCDWIFWCSRCVESRAFALVAGFVAAGMLARTRRAHAPLRALARDRAKRLGQPLLLGVLLALPAMYFIWGWGWVQFGFATWPKVLEASFGPAVGPHFAGLAHLWFLPACLLSTLLLIALAHVLGPLPAAAALCAHAGSLLASPLRLLVLVPTTAALFHVLPTSLIVFSNGFFPAPGHYLLHALFFAVGAGLWLSRERLRAVTRWWPIELALGALALALGVPMLLEALRTPGFGDLGWYLPGANAQPTLPWQASLLAAIAAWCMLFGTLGACIRCGPSLRGCVAWLVARQLWVYVAHLPFVGLVWASLYAVAMPSEAKAGLAFLAGLGGPLLLHAAHTRWFGSRASNPGLPSPARHDRLRPSDPSGPAPRA